MEKKKQRLVLIDAMALLYRAYFSLYKQMERQSDRFDGRVLYGFTRALFDIIAKLDPTHVMVAMDGAKPTWRHALYGDYKAHREKQPESISGSMEDFNQLMEAFGFPIFQKEGEEADDLLGTLAIEAAKAGFSVHIATPDKDLGQLVAKEISLYRPATGGKGGEFWDEEAVQSKWGIEKTSQVIDMIALMGDRSDNIPGVQGIGPKSAAKLLKSYQTLEKIFENLDQVPPSLEKKLRDGQEMAFLSKKLATIRCNIPLSIDWESACYHPPKKKRLLPLLKRLGFASLIRQFFPEEAQKKAAPLLDALEESAPKIEEKEDDFEKYHPKESDYAIVQGEKAIQEMITTLSKKSAFCFDIESTSLDREAATLLGIAFSAKEKVGHYLPIPKDLLDNQEKIAAFLAPLHPLFGNKEVIKIAHNLKYDASILQKYGLHVKGKCFDTLIAHHLVIPDAPHNLNAIARDMLGYNPIDITTLIGEKGKKQGSMADVPLEQLAIYACEDADITFRIYHLLKEKIKSEGMEKLFECIEMPLAPILLAMEIRGIAIDQEKLEKLGTALKERMVALRTLIHEESGADFNIDSPKQLGEVLFEKMQLVEKPVKTKSGQYSTNEAILSKMKKKAPIIENVLAYREAKKLHSTYVDRLPALASPMDGRIHTLFRQDIVTTGRLSSSKPNLQNIPIRSEQGKAIRAAFVPKNQDYLLVSADYSQIELRLMAHFSKDEAMQKAFQAGKDIHALTASKIFDCPEALVTSAMRRKAKMVNFGIIYGISAYGLSQRLDIPRKEAAEIIGAYFSKFPAVKAYMANCIENAKKMGYVKTLWGRKRFLPDINSRNATTRGFAERNAINMPIQGSAAELIKEAMIAIEATIAAEKMDAKMLLQVHDELLFEVKKSEVAHFSARIRGIMEGKPKNLWVPIEVSIGSGADWLEAHP